jgi:hypothetical protein
MKSLKSLISRLLGSIQKRGYSIQNDNLFKVGSLTFAGNEMLKHEILDAFDFLKGIDADVYEKLMSFEAFFVHHHEKLPFGKPHFADHESKVYSFTDSDIAWKRYGLNFPRIDGQGGRSPSRNDRRHAKASTQL